MVTFFEKTREFVQIAYDFSSIPYTFLQVNGRYTKTVENEIGIMLK